MNITPRIDAPVATGGHRLAIVLPVRRVACQRSEYSNAQAGLTKYTSVAVGGRVKRGQSGPAESFSTRSSSSNESACGSMLNGPASLC